MRSRVSEEVASEEDRGGSHELPARPSVGWPLHDAETAVWTTGTAGLAADRDGSRPSPDDYHTPHERSVSALEPIEIDTTRHASSGPVGSIPSDLVEPGW